MEQKQEPQQVMDDAAATTENYDSDTKQKKKKKDSPSSWLPSDAGSISTTSDAALRTHGKRRNFCRNRSGTRITIRLSRPAPTKVEWRRHSGKESTFFFRLPKHAGAFIITACPIVTLPAITSKVQTSLSLSLCLSLCLSLREAQNKTKLPVEPNLQKNSLFFFKHKIVIWRREQKRILERSRASAGTNKRKSLERASLAFVQTSANVCVSLSRARTHKATNKRSKIRTREKKQLKKNLWTKSEVRIQ
jgi:hypothetical protein